MENQESHIFIDGIGLSGYRTHLVSQETANLRNKSRRKQRWILVVA